MKLSNTQLDHLSFRLRDLEQENEVLVGALAEAEDKVCLLQGQLERLELAARPLTVHLSRSLQPS